MELDPETFKQIVETFNTELDEQLQVITDGLLLLEKSSIKDENYIKTIDKLFRSAHNIKGSAQGLGINDIGELAHHLESMFSNQKKKSTELTGTEIDLCLEAIDAMRLSILAFIAKEPVDFDINQLIQRLKNYDISSERIEKKENINKPVKKKQNKDGEKKETIRVSINNLDKISALMEEMQANKIAIDDHYLDLKKLNKKTKHFTQLWNQTLSTINDKFGSDLGEHLQKLFINGNDSLIDLNNFSNQIHRTLHPHINELTLLSNALDEEIRMLRLVPVSTLMRTFPLLVRDLSNELNKKVELEINGDDVKIDKMVLEGLKNPITHILRNAIDHGIEPEEERKANGKNPRGHITINIKEVENQIEFIISDDGAGIDTNSILEHAKNKKIFSEAELKNMNENELLELIFRPGFSTKEIITDVSGRGIGLDIVKSNLSNLKGHVTVTTDLSKGTTFILKVPLTLATDRGLLITSCGHIFVIPISHIERVLMIRSEDIIEVEGSHAILIDNHPIPIRNLSDILELNKSEGLIKQKIPIVVLKKSWNNVALVVDEIIGEREIVIKPLQEPLTNASYVIGGTLAGNGEVIMVLNANDIIYAAFHSRSKHIHIQSATKKVAQRPRILVVDDSITTRTLEKNVLENKGYQVIVAVNGKEAWDLLQKEKFNLLITDVTMPMMDGFALTENVKQNDKLKELPVIIVTSLGSETEKKRGVEVGADAYIVKSDFESGTLLEIVSQLV